MAKFARIIELENDEQVLLLLEEDQYEDTFNLVVRTDVGPLVGRVTYGFSEEKKALEGLEKYSMDQAITFRKSIVEMFNES